MLIEPLFIVATSAASFAALNRLFGRFYPSGEKREETETETDRAVECERRWRWKNVSTSFVHAVVAGGMALYSYWTSPELLRDLAHAFSPSGYRLVAISLGYFVYDFFDMVLFNRTRQSMELMLHHIIIFLCHGIALHYRLYIGYAVFSLLAELNSIFLHSRQLMLMKRVDTKSFPYRLCSITNLATFLIFRIGVLAYMTRWQILHRHEIPLSHLAVGSVGLVVMTAMNAILLKRLLKSDFGRKRKSR